MRARLASVVVAVALLGTACATVQPVPEDHFYRLSPAVPASPGSVRPLSGVLAIGAIDSAGIHRERAIVYTQAGVPTELLRYHYHAWIEGPPRLIQDHLLAYLRGSGAASLVMIDDARTRWDYLLSGNLRRFERVMKVGGGSDVAVELELQLDRRGSERPLLVRDYSASAPVHGADLGDAVRAFSVALQQIYARFLADLAALPPSASKP